MRLDLIRIRNPANHENVRTITEKIYQTTVCPFIIYLHLYPMSIYIFCYLLSAFKNIYVAFGKRVLHHEFICDCIYSKIYCSVMNITENYVYLIYEIIVLLITSTFSIVFVCLR